MTLRGMSVGEIRICFPGSVQANANFPWLHFAGGHLPCSSLLQRIDQSQAAPTYIRSEIRLPLWGADPEPGLQHPANAA